MIIMIEENLKSFKKKQSKIMEIKEINLTRTDEEIGIENSDFNDDRIYNIINIFGSTSTYKYIMNEIKKGAPIKQYARKLNEYYSAIKPSVNRFLKFLIQHMYYYLEFLIIELLWGFCLPNNQLTENDYTLETYNTVNINITMLKELIEECTPYYKDDADFEPYNIEKINDLHDRLKSIVKIKINLNEKNSWDGEYITEDEIYRHCIDKDPSIILIEELEEYLSKKTYKFPYDELTPLESELLNSVLLLKIKENQPHTIRIDENMVMPQSYWTEGELIQGTRF